MPENTVANYEAAWWIATILIVLAAGVAGAYLAARHFSQKARWCVYIEGPDELECYPNKEAAERRALDLNTFFRQMPKTKFSPPIFAKAILSPFTPEDHDAEMARCRAQGSQPDEGELIA